MITIDKEKCTGCLTCLSICPFTVLEEVDGKLKDIMAGIYSKVSEAAARYGYENNFVVGANIAGFEKVATAMMAQGLV